MRQVLYHHELVPPPLLLLLLLLLAGWRLGLLLAGLRLRLGGAVERPRPCAAADGRQLQRGHLGARRKLLELRQLRGVLQLQRALQRR